MNTPTPPPNHRIAEKSEYEQLRGREDVMLWLPGYSSWEPRERFDFALAPDCIYAVPLTPHDEKPRITSAVKDTLMNGTLTISKASDDTIRIRLIDSLSQMVVTDIQTTPEQFAQAVFGTGFRPCTFELRTDKVGLRREVKTENVYPDSNTEALTPLLRATAAVMRFEVDGWKGNLSDALNHHKRGPDGSYRVTFERWVPVEDAP
jgi:hypothetical protein